MKILTPTPPNWRWVIQVAFEYFRGIRTFSKVGPMVSIFGSARLPEYHPACQLAYQLGRMLAQEGIAVLTGGGPGVMEAANRGAQEAGGKSLGANILIPHEQSTNRFVDQVVNFDFFFARKSMLLGFSRAHIFLPGGFGTLDELTESVILLQTGKLRPVPLVLIGKDYWSGLLEWLDQTVLPTGTITRLELERLFVTDRLDEVLEHVQAAIQAPGASNKT